MKKIYYILIFIFLVSCTSNTIYEKPKDLIPKDTMTNLLTDLYLASSASNIKNINLEIKVKYMPLVYDKYLIDSLRFKKSNIYYLSNIDEYSILLNNVKDSLVLLAKKYKKKDSVEYQLKKKEKLKKLRGTVKVDD
ncbi:MAG: DUF4296 domain-containing protein [Flavobacteriaceae bacterium]